MSSMLLFGTPCATYQLQNGTTAKADSNGFVLLPDAMMAVPLISAGSAIAVDISPAVATAGRPTTGLVVGMNLYDTTLNKPIWLKNLTPTWVDATGATV